MAKLNGICKTGQTTLDYVLENEGGFTIDSGGPTNYGIVKDDLALLFEKDVSEISDDDIRYLSREVAEIIYQTQYFSKMHLNLINDQNIATVIFDTGVNRGIRIGQLYAQKACVALGVSLNVDGILGPRTAKAINDLWPYSFIRAYESLVMAGYEAIIEHNPEKYAIYRKGWENRAKKLLTLA